jgi:hypothetical protein
MDAIPVGTNSIPVGIAFILPGTRSIPGGIAPGELE